MVNDAKMRKFDDSLFDVIVFDEILKNYSITQNKIKHYVEGNPDKIISATGDTDQNKPVNSLSIELEHKEYAYHCVSMIFPNQIKLKINKRLDSEEGRKLIEDVKTDFLDKKIPLIKSIEKYFKFTDHPSDNNISYRNEVAEDVSRTKRKLLGKTSEYELGEKLFKKSQKKPYSTEKRKGSYKRQSQPVDKAGEHDGKKSIDDMFAKLESKENKKEKMISEEMQTMKNLISYNRKTQ